MNSQLGEFLKGAQNMIGVKFCTYVVVALGHERGPGVTKVTPCVESGG